MTKGYIAALEREAYRHRFGGSSWKVSDPNKVDDGPALVLVLDLADSRLKFLEMGSAGELPLVSYLNNSIWWKRQTYRIGNGEVVLVERSVTTPESLEPEYWTANPLPERPLSLRPPRREEDPDLVGMHDAANTLFGPAFIRIGGTPVWTQFPEEVNCTCGRAMVYAATIGYYRDVFFIGEGALYFFVCAPCTKQTVLMQSS